MSKDIAGFRGRRDDIPPMEAVGMMRATALALADELKRVCGVPGWMQRPHAGHVQQRPEPTEDDFDLWRWASISRGL